MLRRHLRPCIQNMGSDSKKSGRTPWPFWPKISLSPKCPLWVVYGPRGAWGGKKKKFRPTGTRTRVFGRPPRAGAGPTKTAGRNPPIRLFSGSGPRGGPKTRFLANGPPPTPPFTIPTRNRALSPNPGSISQMEVVYEKSIFRSKFCPGRSIDRRFESENPGLASF